MFTDYKESRKFSYKSFSITTAINSLMLYIRFVLAQINPVIITQMSPIGFFITKLSKLNGHLVSFGIYDSKYLLIYLI